MYTEIVNRENAFRWNTTYNLYSSRLGGTLNVTGRISKIALSTSGLYKITWCCGNVYVGETKTKNLPRVQEHMRRTNERDTEKSAAVEDSY